MIFLSYYFTCFTTTKKHIRNITTFEESSYVNQYTNFHYAEVLYIIIFMHMGLVGLLFNFNQTNTNP